MQGKMGRLLGVVLLAGCPGPRAAASLSPLTTIGFYTFVPIHSQLPFLEPVGTTWCSSATGGYTMPPGEFADYYARLSRDLRPYQAAGMRVWILLLANMAQYHGESGRQTELGMQDWLFDPADTEAMEERLEMLTGAVRRLRGVVDGSSFFAGDPVRVPLAWGGSSVEARMDMARKVHAIVRREAPRAQFNANPWAVTQWEDLHMNCFRGRFWAREATNTRVVLWEPEPLGPSCGIELSMHKYCRSLALNSLLQERMPIELSPDARDVQRLRRRGVSRVWAWPYFPLDEVDNGDLREGFRVPQSETRYIQRFVDQARKIGINGIIGNGGFAEDQCVELVNL